MTTARAALAALILAASAFWSLPVGGQEGDGEQASLPLRLVAQTAWIEPGGDFSIQVRANDAPPGATVRATVHPTTSSRSDFTQELAGEALQEPIADTGAVSAEAPGLIRLRFTTGVGPPAPDVTAADLPAAGVYPVQVRLARSDGTLIHRFVTHVVRLPGPASDAAPLTFSLVVPVDGGPGLRPSGNNGLRPEGRARVRGVTAALADHGQVPVTVVPSPDTAEALAGTNDLAAIRRAIRNRQVLISPYVPIDLSAWVAGGMDDELVFETTEGETTLEEYLGVRPDRRSWVADAAITAEALSRVRELGADQVVIPETSLAPLDSSVFPVTLAQPFEVENSAGGRQRAAMSDAGLESHLGQSGDPVLDAHTTLADLAVIAFDRPTLDRGAVLVLPTDWTPPGAFLDVLLGALGQPSIVDAATLDQFFERVPAATAGGESGADGTPLVRSLSPVPPADLGDYPEDRAITRLSIEGFSSLTGAANPRVPSLRRRLLVSGSSAFGRTQRQAYIDAIGAEIDEAVAAVRAPDQLTVTLTSRTGRIPVNISNENLFDVEVLVRFESDKLEFSDGAEVPLTLPRSSVTRLQVDVSSRSSGTFPLRITLTSPNRVLQVGRTDVTVRSTAISGIGVMLSIGAGLFLAIWWARHFHGVRRARKLVGEAPP